MSGRRYGPTRAERDRFFGAYRPPADEGKAYWRRQHQGKQKHATPDEAQEHADELNAQRVLLNGQFFEVYSCTWADAYRYGQTARRHWHTGRSKQK